MQPIVKSDSVIRFKANAIVALLLEESAKRGFNLNDLAIRDFSQADWEQFYQLIGYSLSGYHELSNVSDVSALDATLEARKIDDAAKGCRDTGCKVHCGVRSIP